jgi:GDP-mannose 6-dehydrogenase
MRISIFGLGYVGCVSAGCLAQKGHDIIGIDVSPDKVNAINQGKQTVIEKGLDQLIEEGFRTGKISATMNYIKAIEETEISIIAVGTPSSATGHLNLEYIYKVAKEIGEGIKNKSGFHIVSIRSTVMPGTNKLVGEIIENCSGKNRNIDFAVVSNPEFLREGSAIQDYFNPPVTVLGSDNDFAIQKFTELYRDINAPVKIVDIKVAEIIKYVNNSFHALKITFANEIGNICKNLGIDSHEVMDLFIMDKQLNISPYYLKPGFAYGGSCLPKDLKGLKTIAHDLYMHSPLLESIEESNRIHKKLAAELIEKHIAKDIGILGLSFKDGTDDLRNSPIVEIVEYLIGKGYHVNIYDKYVSISKLTGTNKDFIDKHIPHLYNLISDDLEEVIRKSSTIVITYKTDGIEEFIEKYAEKTFIDFARITNKQYSNYEGICW